MRKIPLVNGEYYHVFNRGVNSGRIFDCQADYQRFYHSLFLFNDKNYKSSGGDRGDDLATLASVSKIGDYRNRLVSVIAFCLLPNHFHLFLRQEQDGGISQFMSQIGRGYARYFNLKSERTGPLFDSRFQSAHVDNESHLLHVPRYIHLNGLDLTDIHWRDGVVVDWNRARAVLDSYPWSSHRTYQGIEQQIPVIYEELMQALFPSPRVYDGFLSDWSGRFILDDKKIRDRDTDKFSTYVE